MLFVPQPRESAIVGNTHLGMLHRHVDLTSPHEVSRIGVDHTGAAFPCNFPFTSDITQRSRSQQPSSSQSKPVATKRTNCPFLHLRNPQQENDHQIKTHKDYKDHPLCTPSPGFDALLQLILKVIESAFEVVHPVTKTFHCSFQVL